MAQSLTITYLNRDGGGFAERVPVSQGTTIAQFLDTRQLKANDYTIRVLRVGQGTFTPTAEEPFQEGDRLSCVPLKIEGARA